MRMNQPHKDQGKNIPDAKNKCEGLKGTKLAGMGLYRLSEGVHLELYVGFVSIHKAPNLGRPDLVESI